MAVARNSGEDRGADSDSIRYLTTLSPIRPERLGSLRRRLAFVAWAPGLGRPLLDLATIHHARWIIVPSLPHPDGGPRRWPLNWHYLLFDATYDGPAIDYLDTFSDVIPDRISAVFGTCFGFEARVEDAPGADRGGLPAYAFREYVRQNQLSALETRSYLTETAKGADRVGSIRQALAIERMQLSSRPLSGPALGRAQSKIEALALGPPSSAPGWRDAVLGPWLRKARPGRSINPLTIAAPVSGQGVDGLAGASLAGLEDTLSARLTLLPRNMQAHLGQQYPDRLPAEYLLFTSDYYGALDDYIETIRSWRNVDSVFGHCVEYPGRPGRRRFRDWILRHTLDVQYYVSGYASRPVKELNDLLKVRRQIARWSLDRSIDREERDR